MRTGLVKFEKLSFSWIHLIEAVNFIHGYLFVVIYLWLFMLLFSRGYLGFVVI